MKATTGSMTAVTRYISCYLAVFLVYTVVLLSLFHVPIFDGLILFYRGIVISALTFTAVVTLRLLPFRRLWQITSPTFADWFSATIASASVHFCFFVVVPVTIDRSVTTFLLVQMSKQAQTAETAMSKEELNTVFTRDYLFANDAIGRRMQEQIASKNIVEIPAPNGQPRYMITAQGHSFVDFARLVGKLYATSDTVLR
jgi:hypothetical protein